MTERMILIGWFGRQFIAKQRHDAAGAVRQIIKGIRSDRDGIGQHPHDQFHEKQHKIAGNPGQTAERTIPLSDFWVLRLFIIRYKPVNQPFCHVILSFQQLSVYHRKSC